MRTRWKLDLATSDEHNSRPRRRQSSGSNTLVPSIIYPENQHEQDSAQPGATSGLPTRAFAQPLSTIPATPPPHTPPMSLSRSPSPQPNGGWSTPGLTDQPSHDSPRRIPYEMNGYASNNISWAAAKAKSDQFKGYPSFSTRNEGFFSRSKRKISSTLPRFNSFGATKKDWRESEKLGRGRWYPGAGGRWPKLKTFIGNVLRKFRLLFIVLAIIAFIIFVMSKAQIRAKYRRNARFGGGSKFVIIVAANPGGGVMDWKGPREWAIERDSVKNKRKYAERWGYDLEIADMSTKKRYAHEWRESWEKVDIIRNCMRKFPDAEWFWWLDLNTLIMEPSYSLQSHIFNSLAANTYRDINVYNPLNISHPPQSEFLDSISRSATGDNLTSSIDLIVPQDCSGFNLGSFFVRRSVWTDRLLDIWWDPVCYEQKHMEWEHKEQDALEYLYTNQPWIRPHTAFIEQRKINSFPPGACGKDGKQGDEALDERIHYREKDRDFMVNMAGCEWGRDCWGEMFQYRELSNKLNRNWKERVREWWNEQFKKEPAAKKEQKQEEKKEEQKAG